MATSEEQRLKNIADALQQTYESLRKSAAQISGLLQLGRATCAEVKTYNVFALMIWNAQRGMLSTLKAAGQNVPSEPPMPTLFTWKGIQGSEAWKINCDGQNQPLSGLMGTALRGPDENTQYLSTNDIDISTTDQWVYNPESAPSFKMLMELQAHRENEKQQQIAGLGIGAGVLIVIAVISIVVVGAVVSAILKYLETNAIQEANVKQVKLQADAFANYTASRLACYQTCVQQGGTNEVCLDRCAKLIDKPNIKTSWEANGTWGLLQWTGFTVLAGFGAIVAWKLWQRHRDGKPLLSLPESDTTAA
jgi:hypothetical protein